MTHWHTNTRHYRTTIPSIISPSFFLKRGTTVHPAHSTKLCKEVGWGVREAGWKHEWRVTSQRLLKQLLFAPTRKQCRLSPEGWISRIDAKAADQTKQRPASAGTLGERGCGGPSTQVLTLRIIRAIKLPPNQQKKKEKDNRKKG